MDQDSAFMSNLMSYLFRKLNIKIMTVAPYNHQSLQAEHGIKTLSQILTKHLSGQGQMWHKYLPLATFAHNTFNSPNLANHSPYELVFGRKLKITVRFGDGSRCENIRNTQRISIAIEKEIRVFAQTFTRLSNEKVSTD